MADFTLMATAGVSVEPWLDPPSSTSQPSRLNDHPGFPQRRCVGQRFVPITLKAVVGGVVAPADGALGGRLFVAWPVEAPVMPFVGISSLPGFSSTITVIPDYIGHYTIGVRRPDGGIEHFHVDVG